MLLLIAILFSVQSDDAAVLRSIGSQHELELSTDPASDVWTGAPPVLVTRNYLGEPVEGPPTEIRSRWTVDHLYLLYVCPYEELNLRPDPDTTAETPRLWNWDVAEAFIGSDLGPTARYREFQVSPQGEWIDLDIDRENPKGQAGAQWNSGFIVAARIDAQKKIWYGVMKIPFKSIDGRTGEKGRSLRAGLYRIAGAAPRTYYAWRPTGQTSFHVPQAFGTIRLD